MKTLLLSCALVALLGQTAAAQSKHVASVAPIKNAAGQTVGARFKVTLMPAAGHNNGGSVQLGLGLNGKAVNNYGIVMQNLAAQYGYVAHWLPVEVNVTQPVEKTYDVIYGQGNQLSSGTKVEVFSFWSGRHLWGANRTGGLNEPVFVLP
jgi:hypothetical protein